MAEAIANPTIAALRAATAPGVTAPQGPQALSFPWMRAATTMSRAPSTPTRSTAQSAKSTPPVNPPAQPTQPPASRPSIADGTINPDDPSMYWDANFRGGNWVNSRTPSLPGGGSIATPSVPPIAPPGALTPPASAIDPVLQPVPRDPTNDPGMNDFNWDSWFDTDVAQPAAPAPVAPTAPAPAQPSQPVVEQPPPSNPIVDPSFDWSKWLPAQPTQPAAEPTVSESNPFAFNWDEISYLGLDPSVFMVPGATLPQQPVPEPVAPEVPQYQPDLPSWYFDQWQMY